MVRKFSDNVGVIERVSVMVGVGVAVGVEVGLGVLEGALVGTVVGLVAGWVGISFAGEAQAEIRLPVNRTAHSVVFVSTAVLLASPDSRGPGVPGVFGPYWRTKSPWLNHQGPVSPEGRCSPTRADCSCPYASREPQDVM